MADALSRRHLSVQENQVQVLGFEHLRDLYETDNDFQCAYRACNNLVEVDKISMHRIHVTRWFTIQEQ